jgi:hypothetical protein
MVQYLVKHRDNFTFTFYRTRSRQVYANKEEDVTKLPFKDRCLVGKSGTEHLDANDDFFANHLNSLLKIFYQQKSLADLSVPHGGTEHTAVS